VSEFVTADATAGAVGQAIVIQRSLLRAGIEADVLVCLRHARECLSTDYNRSDAKDGDVQSQPRR
jgi:hypothetical protein